jgi:hypothetical protein
MALRKKKDYEYGDGHADLRASMRAWAKDFGEPIHRFADVKCKCGGDLFTFTYDDDAGVVRRRCSLCCSVHVMCDGTDYIDEVEHWNRPECICRKRTFQATVGVNLYRGSADVHWFFLGLRCAHCSLLGVYAEWKSECEDYKSFLANA